VGEELLLSMAIGADIGQKLQELIKALHELDDEGFEDRSGNNGYCCGVGCSSDRHYALLEQQKISAVRTETPALFVS
jgi:hypothetical protein